MEFLNIIKEFIFVVIGVVVTFFALREKVVKVEGKVSALEAKIVSLEEDGKMSSKLLIELKDDIHKIVVAINVIKTQLETKNK